MGYLTTAGYELAGIMATDPWQPASGSLALGALETRAIPVDLSSTSYRTLYRVVLGAVTPGDMLRIDADARVTNNCGYTIGVGWHLWMYDYNNPLKTNGPWWRISHLMGDNVDRTRHHMPLHISTLYRMPDDWPAGHRPVIVLRADAHSTAWQSGDTLTVDAGYGQLIVEHYKPTI
ncbi:hypothetical protein GCM10010293_41090 [Streptomyces griseoflavus]|uniref:hypothetical protein n=1 Tax=Streptomyces griseoflavus TaxID=35619 RepID=UPI00167E1C1F|nr:hypothetical protein [Streptomyces griseoflavus]GGV37324.1 hypothetical protein GCM10010293_41090 [Streptomyces griseoflavus]